MKEEDKSDYINSLIDECIDHLADDSPSLGANSLIELANIFAKAGMTKASFGNIRKFIVTQAIERTDPIFIQEKLKIAERELRNNRDGKIIVTVQ